MTILGHQVDMNLHHFRDAAISEEVSTLAPIRLTAVCQKGTFGPYSTHFQLSESGSICLGNPWPHCENWL